jgi:hypothetical protein
MKQVITDEMFEVVVTLRFALSYKREGARTKERLRWQGPAAYIKVRPVLSSERAPHKKKKTVIVI